MDNKERFVAIEERYPFSYRIEDNLKLIPPIYFLNRQDMYDFYNKLIRNTIRIGEENSQAQAEYLYEKHEQLMKKLEKDIKNTIEDFFNDNRFKES